MFELPYVLKLQYPVEIAGEVKSELTFPRRLKARDMKGIKAGDIRMDDMMLIASRLTGELPPVIAELDGQDFLKVSEVVSSFLGGSPESGTN